MGSQNQPSCLPHRSGFVGISMAAEVRILHLSDIHISTTLEKPIDFRERDLRYLAKTIVKTYKPDIILVTGDLADAKGPYNQPRQHVEEWEVSV